MKYLKITNKGLIVPEDLMLIGSSTKREQTGKIGMFGSGWKYALAWLMRNDCKPIIYSGDKTITVDFNVVMHRDTPVRVITVDGRETSLTTEMGPKWTGWMAVREILSNAIDEGNHTISIVDDPADVNSGEDTAIFIPMNGELITVMDNFDSYFAFNRKEDYKCKYGRVFIKDVKSKIAVYRKGIKCFDSSFESYIDFDFENISINEDRLTQDYYVGHGAENMMSQDDLPKEVLLAYMKTEKESYFCTIDDHHIELTKELLAEKYTFTTSMMNRIGGIFGAPADSLLIPSSWYAKLQQLGLVKSIFDLLAGSSEPFIPTGKKDVSGIHQMFAAFNMNVTINSGICSSDIFVNNSIIYINESTTCSDESLFGHALQKMNSSFFIQQYRQLKTKLSEVKES